MFQDQTLQILKRPAFLTGVSLGPGNSRIPYFCYRRYGEP